MNSYRNPKGWSAAQLQNLQRQLAGKDADDDLHPRSWDAKPGLVLGFRV